MKNVLLILIPIVLVAAGFLAWKAMDDQVLEPEPFQVELIEGETVSSWDFSSAYTSNPELEARADADIERLTALLADKKSNRYILYVSIANQYGLKGDGKNELAYLEKALAIDSEGTGLAWHNAGQLFARLGAYRTAKMALERAVAAQPIAQYERALADFLEAHPGLAAQ